MAKRKRQKKTSAAGYIEKISSQIFDIVKKDLEKSFRVAPAEIKKIKKALPGLKKQVKNRLKKELKKSFKVTPSATIKKLPALKKRLQKKIKEELKRSFRITPAGGTKRAKKKK